MKWYFFCNDGSPIGVVPQDIFGARGVGGAELALLSLTATLAELGHEVWIFNNPRETPKNTEVHFAPKAQFFKQPKSDVFVLFRSPNQALEKSKAKVKLFWSCDQYTVGNYTKQIFPFVDRIVTISPFHTDYHVKHWDAKPKKIGHIDLGVRLQDYEDKTVEKVKGLAIYCSVPGRGLKDLHDIWPQIYKQMPEARLIITSDFSLWGAPSPRNREWRLRFARTKGVKFLGKVPRKILVHHQLQAQAHLFPCVYEELFCISAAECQAAGAVPITTRRGALATTNRWGIQIRGDPSTTPWRAKFIEHALEALAGGLEDLRQAGIEGASREFRWTTIAGQWVDLVERSEFPLSSERGGSK